LLTRVLKQELADTDESLAKVLAALRSGGPAPLDAVPISPKHAAPAPVEAAQVSEERAPRDERWVPVHVNRIDGLCERVAEFESDFRALGARLLTALGGSPQQRSLTEDFDRCRALLDDVSGAAWSLRLVPVEPALEEQVRHARELAAELGKKLRVAVK